MRVLTKATCILSTTALMTCAIGSGVLANEELQKLSSDPKNWAMPTGDYANTRYSKLTRSPQETSRTCRSSGRSRPACCAATKAARW